MNLVKLQHKKLRQKSLSFLYSINERSEREIKETTPFIITSQILKYLEINLRRQRHQEDTQENPVHTRTQGPHRRPSPTCLSVLACLPWIIGQQWPAAGTVTPAAADLGGTAWGTSPLGGGHHWLHHKASEQTTHKLQDNYTEELLALFCCKTSRAYNRFPNLGIW